MKRGRKLRDDELMLWRQVAKTTDRLPEMSEMLEQDTDPTDFVEQKQRFAFDSLPPRKDPSGGPTFQTDVMAPVSDRVATAPLRMDQKTFTRMKRGVLKPEARIDLHGMTLDRAHPALTRFILSEHGKGRRLVLVITGKGKARDTDDPIPARFGVLRHQVPQWLGMAPLSHVVLQVTQAHQRHGGGGAYYVYLKRMR